MEIGHYICVLIIPIFFSLKETAEKVPVISCFIAPLKTQSVPAPAAAASSRASWSCSLTPALSTTGGRGGIHRDDHRRYRSPPPKDQSTDSSQPRMILIQSSSKSRSATRTRWRSMPGLSCQATKETTHGPTLSHLQWDDYRLCGGVVI